MTMDLQGSDYLSKIDVKLVLNYRESVRPYKEGWVGQSFGKEQSNGNGTYGRELERGQQVDSKFPGQNRDEKRYQSCVIGGIYLE